MVRAEPDRASLETAHGMLRVKTPLDDMLKNPTFRIILRAVACRQMRRGPRVDVKKLQANDHD